MKLILCGGGSGEQNKLANEKLNEFVDHNKPILYIPLAMDEIKHPYDGCFNWIHEELQDVDVPSIEMVRTFEELSKKEYSNYSVLFIGGGNTYKLLKGLKESGSYDKIKEYINNDGVVIGGSAGAVIFGKDIDIIAPMDPNDVNLKDTMGFDTLNGISIFPHYTNGRSTDTEEQKQRALIKFTNAITEFSLTKGEVIAIPEEDAIVVIDNTYEIIGTRPFYIFKNGISEKFEINQKVK